MRAESATPYRQVKLTNVTKPWDAWFTGSFDEATALQKPLRNDALQIVATGGKSDWAPVDE
jgi:putative SOS response-associated peptidase YedK